MDRPIGLAPWKLKEQILVRGELAVTADKSPYRVGCIGIKIQDTTESDSVPVLKFRIYHDLWTQQAWSTQSHEPGTGLQVRR